MGALRRRQGQRVTASANRLARPRHCPSASAGASLGTPTSSKRVAPGGPPFLRCRPRQSVEGHGQGTPVTVEDCPAISKTVVEEFSRTYGEDRTREELFGEFLDSDRSEAFPQVVRPGRLEPQAF
jgi:hypothetical protein